MIKTAPEIVKLRQEIEERLERRMQTPADFGWLSLQVWERLHETISPTTLKRLWGYINGAETVRPVTLNILSKLVGYQDFYAFEQHLQESKEDESDTFRGEGIRTDDLQIGDIVEVTWLPNRRCQFRNLGNHRFEVLIAEHAKLQVGDSFTTAAFFIGQPMYADNVKSNDRNRSPLPSYIAGKRNGIISAKIVNGK